MRLTISMCEPLKSCFTGSFSFEIRMKTGYIYLYMIQYIKSANSILNFITTVNLMSHQVTDIIWGMTTQRIAMSPERLQWEIYRYVMYIDIERFKDDKQSSDVIVRSTMTWFCIWYDNDWGKICICDYIHKRHRISRPKGVYRQYFMRIWM